MFTEELIEEGIVISSSNGFAEVLINKNDNCKDCELNILCKPKGNNTTTLKVLDPFYTKPGDYIKISINGKSILKTSFFIYGIPLALFLVIVTITYLLFFYSSIKEIISFFIGVIFVFTYIILLKKIYPIKLIPKIIYVKR